MNQNNDTNLKCPNSEHVNNVKLVCVNESCKADRLQCIQCIQNGIHVSHLQNQQDLPFLFYHNSNIEKPCEDVIIDLNKLMDMAYQQFYLLIGGIRSKYQKSKHQFLELDSKQKNSFFAENFQDQLQNNYSDLKLSELNLYQISNLDFNKSEELHKKGYEIYQNDKNFKEAIKIFDESLIFNPKHSLSLWCKAGSLRMLGQYNVAIVCADKALQVDPKHCNLLCTKSNSQDY